MSSPKKLDLGDHRAILLNYEDDYRRTKGKARQDIVDDIINEIVGGKGKLKKGAMKGLELVSQLFYWYNLEISSTWTQKIQNWYGNHKNVPLGEEGTLVRVGTVWNYRLVIQHVFKDEIAETMERTGLKSTDRGWIKKFQGAVNEVIDSIGGDDAAQEKYGEMAKTWNEIEPPEELKRKWVLV